MPRKKVLILATVIVLIGFLATTARAFAASKEKVLFSFDDADGYMPASGVIFDASGNLYGTTWFGPGCGGVFKLVPTAKGKWAETLLYTFNDADGCAPIGGLIFDASGNLYGTTESGGVNGYGYGTVFELSPGSDGTWTETVLYSFCSISGCADGATPWGGLVLDAAGNLYGTTQYGGSCQTYYLGCGTVFELTPSAVGGWTEKVLHSFNNDGKDGSWPLARLTIDAAGNLYGMTTYGGGAHNYACKTLGCGTVFELTPSTGGGWTETILHSFNGKDGFRPDYNIIFDHSGNLYGTTVAGGHVGCEISTGGCGVVFQLTPGTDGKWTEKVLRSFYHGRTPTGVTLDGEGNVYGTTWIGGRYGCCGDGPGTAYRLTPEADGRWSETTLHSFGKSGDGTNPSGGLVFDAFGNLYGTTQWGGISGCGSYGYGCGIVFEISP
jgi:uncharacterized repeat protein (TIGR03803 family)